MLLLFLSACAAPGPLAGAAGVPTNPAGAEPINSADSTEEASTTEPTLTPTLEPTATFTPEPTFTATPSYDIHDPDSWPEEMRTYFYGGDAAWSDAEQSSAFNDFLLQVRRELLARSGVANTETLSGEALFNEYLKWGLFHVEELLVFSPAELRGMVVQSLGRESAVFAYRDGNVVQNGIYVNYFESGPITLEYYNAKVGPTANRQTSLQNTIDISILGIEEYTLLPSYYGAYGELLARFRLPIAVNPESSQGILLHFHLNGVHTYLPLIIHFTYTLLPSSSTLVTGTEFLIQYSGDDTIYPLRSSLEAQNDSTNLNATDIQNMLGQRIHVRYENSLTSGYSPGMIFPFALGIPNTCIIIPIDGSLQFTEPSQYPWSTQP